MPGIIDVSNWSEHSWFGTGGTREKKYVSDEEGANYYFKRSMFKSSPTGDKYYKYEFWSEIIAHQVGVHLGFDILEYVPAIDNEHMGCLSRDMIDVTTHDLVGGVQFLQGTLPSFRPEVNANRPLYTFQLIDRAFIKYKLQEFWPDLIEMLVFDAIIGNGDRHQENWALISESIPEMKELAKAASRLSKPQKESILNSLSRIINPETGQLGPIGQMIQLGYFKSKSTNRRFAPLFDNGCCLGRELTHDALLGLLSDPAKFDFYSRRGKSSIYWENDPPKKVTHLELLQLIYESSPIHRGEIDRIVSRVKTQYDPTTINAIIEVVDHDVPISHSDFKIPAERKRFISMLVTSRAERLIQQFYAGI